MNSITLFGYLTLSHILILYINNVEFHHYYLSLLTMKSFLRILQLIKKLNFNLNPPSERFYINFGSIYLIVKSNLEFDIKTKFH